MMLAKRLIGLNLFKNICPGEGTSVSNNVIAKCVRHYVVPTTEITTEQSKIFFSDEAQTLMKELTGLDLDKIYRTRAVGDVVEPPKYEFMTNQQLKEAQANAIRRAYKKLQMPPIVPKNDGEVEILEEVPEMIGFTQSKYVFTDITFNVSDKNRWIVVRQPDGVLRKALPFERHRMNQLYFDREGRSYLHPEMFQEQHLKRLCEEGHFEYILDRAAGHYEPDDEEYHRVIFYTFDKINEKKAFNNLRSTRHFGPLVFYLCINKNVSTLLEEMLETDRLSDAVKLAQLYTVVQPISEFTSLKLDPENRVNYLKTFIELEIKNREKLLQLLDTYWEAHSGRAQSKTE